MKIKFIPIAISVILMLGACQTVETTKVLSSRTPSSKITTEKIQPTYTNTVTPTRKHFTSTPRPTMTPTPTFLPTLTPLEPLNYPELQTKFLETIRDQNCKLPCFMGIIPGQDHGMKTLQLISTIATNINGGTAIYKYELNNLTYQRIWYDIRFNFDEYSIGLDLAIRNDDVIDGLGINYKKFEKYYFTLDMLLGELGVPDDIFIHSASDYGADGNLLFVLELGYRKQGIYAVFLALGEKNGNEIKACLIDPLEMHINISNPTNLDYDSNFYTEQKFLSVEQALGIDRETFYMVYKNPGNPLCMKTKADIWQP